MESIACSYHPVLVKTAKVKATSVAVEQQTLFGWRTAAVWHDCNLEIETYVEAGVRRKEATCAPHMHTKLKKSQRALKMVARLVRQDKKEVNGRHYTRSIVIHKLVLEALFRL